MLPERMDVPKLLASIQTGYDRFKSLLAGLSGEQMTQPGAAGTWSVKDVAAHILVHEQRMLDWIGKRLAGEVPAGPQPYGMPEDELAGLNELIYLENRDRQLAEVLSALDEAHRRSLSLVGAASERDLFDPGRFRLRDGEALWEAIAANTFWHYDEHGRDLRLWLEKQARTPKESP